MSGLSATPLTWTRVQYSTKNVHSTNTCLDNIAHARVLIADLCEDRLDAPWATQVARALERGGRVLAHGRGAVLHSAIRKHCLNDQLKETTHTHTFNAILSALFHPIGPVQGGRRRCRR